MLTPLDIENKKFAKQMMNGYNVEEVDDFLDEVTINYEKLYKESTEYKTKISVLERDIQHYKSMEETLQNTLLVAQTTAEEVKNIAKQKADQILEEAQGTARKSSKELTEEIENKKKELADLEGQIEEYKSKMENLLISQLELIKDMSRDIKIEKLEETVIEEEPKEVVEEVKEVETLIPEEDEVEKIITVIDEDVIE